MSIGFGVVGLGMIADFHAKAIAAADNATLVAGCSRSVDNAQRFADEHGCRGYANLDELLADPDIDAITIATPSGAPLEIIEAAAKSGTHVLVEKPLEVTADRCDRAITVCNEAGVALGGIFPSRFMESARVVKGALDDGRLGRAVLGDAYIKWFRSQEYYDEGGWKGTRRYDGGGALMNQGIHAIDLLLWFMGPVESVSAHTAVLGHTGIEVEDTAVAALRFSSGALGVIEGSTAVYPGYRKKLELSGTAGSISLVDESILTWEFADVGADQADADDAIQSRFADNNAGSGGASDPKGISFEGHRRQVVDFAEAIEAGRAPFIDGAEASRAVDVILAIYESAESQAPVSVRERG